MNVEIGKTSERCSSPKVTGFLFQFGRIGIMSYVNGKYPIANCK